MSSLQITSLIALTAAMQRGVPADEALAAYHSQRSTSQLETAYSNCARQVAYMEERDRPDQVKIQRLWLCSISNELEKRKEGANG